MHGERIGSAHEVVETTGSSNENIAPLAQGFGLLSDGTSAINNTRPKHRSVAELAGLIENLSRQLAGWGNDDN